MILDVQQIIVSYSKQVILHDASIQFTPNKMTALIGPNGCGKSTLLKAIMNFMPLQAGQITFDNRDIRTINRKELAKHIAYLPQESACPDYMTLGELVELSSYTHSGLFRGPSANDRKRFHEVLDIVGLSNKAHLPVNSLSGGQRQRAWIALVLAQNTDMILMDEPVNHLDVKYQYKILQLVRDLSRHYGKTIIIVLHDINLTTSFADRVAMMREGHIIAHGDMATVINENNLQKVFDIPSELFYHKGKLICQPFPNNQALLQNAAQ